MLVSGVLVTGAPGQNVVPFNRLPGARQLLNRQGFDKMLSQCILVSVVFVLSVTCGQLPPIRMTGSAVHLLVSPRLQDCPYFPANMHTGGNSPLLQILALQQFIAQG